MQHLEIDSFTQVQIVITSSVAAILLEFIGIRAQCASPLANTFRVTHPRRTIEMDNIRFLGNDTIHHLLINLTKDEAITFRNAIEQTLEEFSVAGGRQYQPDPCAVSQPNGQRTLLRPFTSETSVGAKLVVELPPGADGKKPPLHGVLIVMKPFSWRKHEDNIVIFGGGMQCSPDTDPEGV
jgi:hypothetical protein